MKPKTTVVYHLQRLAKLDSSFATLPYIRKAHWLSLSSAPTLKKAQEKYRWFKQQNWAKDERWRIVRVTITCCKVN